MIIRKTLASIAGAVAALAMSAPAMAGGIYIGNVDVYATDIASGNTINLLNDVSVLEAAQFCNIDVNVLSAVLGNGKNAKCTSKSNSRQNAYVKKHY
ncbi:hypothetical protein [Actinoplanes aureus]|jgi:hypothetical protein|uniref:Uncharacterized protein n=1 Tax=Actinoplanes aureus TaxID=2792083 RepID=A0A931C491_9ACTN|nr:hypothetical protein [Actinoplanes aureus]MBG0560302.1 hypothetical protein [Actinoplanes aureus]